MPDTGIRSNHFIESSPQDLLNDWLNEHTELEPLKVIGVALALSACINFILMSKRDTTQRWQALAQFTDGSLSKTVMTEASWLAAQTSWAALRDTAFSDANLDAWSTS